MTETTENLLVMVNHWKLSMCAINNAHTPAFRNNNVCKLLLDIRRNNWHLFKAHAVEVCVIQKLDVLCRKIDYVPLVQLFLELERGQKDCNIERDMKQYMKVMKEADEEANNTIHILQIICEILPTDQIPALQSVIRFLLTRIKDLSIGKAIQINSIVDRSFFKFCTPLLSLCHVSKYLWKSKVFLKIFNIFSPESSLEGESHAVSTLCKIMKNTMAAYQTYWQKVCEDQSMSVSELYIVSGRILAIDIQIAERAMIRSIPSSIVDGLKLAGDYMEYMEKTLILKSVFDVLNLKIDEDPHFTKAVSALVSLQTEKDILTMQTLVNASMTFKQIDQLLDSNTFDMLKEFSKSKNLLYFIEAIQREDLRNLIDAVEEHSEQSVQEVTVSSLIHVRRFLEPLLVQRLSNSVVSILKLMHKSINDNMLSRLTAQLMECNTHLHSLKALYHNLANRGEVTKDVVHDLLNDESASVDFQISKSRKVKILLTYKRNRKLNSNELSDYRSRALLLVNTETREHCDYSGRQMENFIEYVDSVMAIADLFEQLFSSDHPDIGNKLTVKRYELQSKAKCLREKLSTWITALEEAREMWYWLNHFHSAQIRQVKQFLTDGSYQDQMISLFESAGCKPANLKSAQKMYAVISKETENDFFSLNAVGATVNELVQQNITVGPVFPDDEDFDPNSVQPLERVQEGELYVVNLDANSAYVMPTLLTIYRNTTGHLPCHHQILFCSKNTSWETLQLHLEKCVGANKKGFPKQLYCIVNVEKLKNEEQFKLVYKLKELENTIHYLAIICKGSTSHPLIYHFSENVHKLRPMLNIAITSCVCELWPNINVLTSDLPGQGKTEWVQCEAFSKELEMVSLHVSGLVSELALIMRLQELSLDHRSLLHLDIGSLSNGEELDIIIFKLSILGFLSSGQHVYQCPTQHISIEIANSIRGMLQNSLPTTQYFNSKEIHCQGFRNLKVSQEVNSPVQVVCHYLKELVEGTLDTSDLYFTGENVVKPLSNELCKDLLHKQFATVGDMSFSVLNNLLNVLSDQLKKMSCSLFLRSSNLVSMISYNTVKSSLLREMLIVSTEFATRSVRTCREEQAETLAAEILQKKITLAKSREFQKLATASAMTERVKGMIQWEESNHLIITFHNQDIQTFSALYRLVKMVPKHVKVLFETQMNKVLPNFSKLTDFDLKVLLQHIARYKYEPQRDDKLSKLNVNYVMTPDNLLKMILIVMRIKSHIPVIIMGETGCGKTSLLRYLANICDIKFLVKNMHAGIEESDITEYVQKVSNYACENLQEYVWLFFDEINTCDHLGLLNDFLCHHIFNGKNLPPNLSILAACNPYKLRGETNIFTAGLATKTKTDEQSQLVYRVHPLPERMVDYVWDFGSLTDSDETAYISSMVDKSLTCLQKDLLVELLVMSQAFVRAVENSPYCVSLRDVNRCRLLIPWFREELLPAFSSHIDSHMKETEAVIMALAHSYHSRLNQTSDREKYRSNMAQLLNNYNVTSSYTLECSGDFVFRVMQKNQREILNKMDLPEGIARNTALQENVFVIFVCLLKHIPIFVVGKPGCSKSLSLQLLKSNLRGKDSTDEYFKKLPQLYFVSFQGSESSTSDGILKVFDKAQNYRLHNKEEDVLPVVILDEIGLAQISTYNPLKVLHSLLEPENKEFPDVAVVGISNWALDAAKMNRAIHLSRPDMDVNELHATGVSIAEASTKIDTSLSVRHRTELRTVSRDDDNILRTLASAYFEYIRNQTIPNFHGLRDFYSLVKFFARKTGSQSSTRTEKCYFILNGLLRNFGGLESEIKYVISTFNIHLDKLRIPLPPLDLSDKSLPSLLQLINDNIKDRNARHLMLLTRGDSSLGIVEDLLRSNERQYMTILGSSFEEDKTDHYSYRILSRIILCMEQGITLILKDLDTIYGSLYDMLNQHYTIVGSKKNCRIALGAYSNPLCQVDDNFRCIVLVEDDKVDLSDPPFLNRFEKQRLVISDVLQPELKEVVGTLQALMEDMSKVSGYESINPEELVPIYDSDMIPSLVHSQYNSVTKSSGDISLENIKHDCLQNIISLCTPEGIIRAKKSSLMTKNIQLMKSMTEQFFSMPLHDGLEAYLMNLMPDCEHGVAAMIFTHSNIYVDLLATMMKLTNTSQFEKLGSFKSEKQLSSSIKRFWADNIHSWLFVQVSHEDHQHFLLMKSILEQERKLHLSSQEEITSIKHVVVIIHVDRTTKQNQLGLVNFLSGWKMAMIDSLESPTIPLKRLLEGTLTDMARVLLEERGLSRHDLFRAFACIQYTEKSRPMGSIKLLIDSIYENKIVHGVLFDLVNNWIGEMDSVRTQIDWQLEVACNTVKLKNFLTFRGALFEDVSSKLHHPVSAAVFVVEKLNGWDYLTSEGDYHLSNEKMILWQALMKDKRVVDISVISEPKGPECYPCKMTTLQTRFPFSKFFIQNIEDLQRIFRDIWRSKQLDSSDGKVDDATCESLYKMFRRSVSNVAAEMFYHNYGKKQFDDYFYDFCQWFTADLPLNMSEEKRIEVFCLAVKSRANIEEEEEFDMFVTKLHVTGWMYKYKIQSELILIDTCLSELTLSLSDILKGTYAVNREEKSKKQVHRKTTRDNYTEESMQDIVYKRQEPRQRTRKVRETGTERFDTDETSHDASGERAESHEKEIKNLRTQGSEETSREQRDDDHERKSIDERKTFLSEIRKPKSIDSVSLERGHSSTHDDDDDDETEDENLVTKSDQRFGEQVEDADADSVHETESRSAPKNALYIATIRDTASAHESENMIEDNGMSLERGRNIKQHHDDDDDDNDDGNDYDNNPVSETDQQIQEQVENSSFTDSVHGTQRNAPKDVSHVTTTRDSASAQESENRPEGNGISLERGESISQHEVDENPVSESDQLLGEDAESTNSVHETEVRSAPEDTIHVNTLEGVSSTHQSEHGLEEDKEDIDSTDAVSESDVAIIVESEDEVNDNVQASSQAQDESTSEPRPLHSDDEASTTSEDQLSVSNESTVISEESEDGSEIEDVVASSLVDLVCRFLIPSQQLRNKSVTSWQSMVNLVLSLTTDVSVQPIILQTLRACNDLASMLILPHDIDEKYFWQIGNTLSTESLDSAETVCVLRQFVLNIADHVPSHHIRHFLSSYASCCLMADTQSNFVSHMFEIITHLPGSIHDVDLIGSVLHHALFLEIENDPEELVKEDIHESDLFAVLKDNLQRSQTSVVDSSFACVLVDVLQNHIFKKTNRNLEKDPQVFLGKILELKRRYISGNPETVKSIIVIGYLKASLQCLASYVKKIKLTENLWQKLNQVFEGGNFSKPSQVQGLQSYFLKCLIEGGGFHACAEVKRNMATTLEYIASLDTCPDRRLYSLEQNPYFLGCTKFYLKICQAVYGLCESNLKPLHELFEQTNMEAEIAYGLFAFAMHEFYLIKSVRNLKGKEEDLSRSLVQEADGRIQSHQLRLLSRICQQEEFGIDFLQLQAPSTGKEYHMVSSVLNILSTIFSSVGNLDNREPKHVFLDCICDPLSTSKRPIPGLPDSQAEIHSYIWEVSPLRTASFYIYSCECSCRLLFKEDSMVLHCPNCKKATVIEKYLHPAEDTTDMDSESMDADSSSVMDSVDVDPDSSIIPDDVDDTSTGSDLIQPSSKLSCMQTVRHLTQASFRIVKFIYFGCLTGGVALKYSTDMEVQCVLHLDEKTNPTEYLHTQLSYQWECLKTILSMGDEQLGRFLAAVLLRAKELLTDSKWHIGRREEREEFEQELTHLVTPLVKRRFQLILEQVNQFKEICREEESEGCLEDVICEVFNEEERNESLHAFWREVSQPSTENMKIEFLLTQSQEKFPVLSLVFSYDKELKLMKHI